MIMIIKPYSYVKLFLSLRLLPFSLEVSPFLPKSRTSRELSALFGVRSPADTQARVILLLCLCSKASPLALAVALRYYYWHCLACPLTSLRVCAEKSS